MKVLHLIDSAGLYGAEQVMLALAQGQRESGIDACIGSIASPGLGEKALETAARDRQVPVIRIEIPSGLSPSAIGALRIRINNLRPEVIHSHGYKANVLSGLVPKRLRLAPLVTTYHGWTSSGGFSRNALYESLDRLVVNRRDAAVVVSKSQVVKLNVRHPENLYVVPNGVAELDALRTCDMSDVQADVEFCKRGPTLVMVGRLSPEKCQNIALRAMALLSVEHPELQLLLMGDGPLRSPLHDLAKSLGLGHAIRLAGYVPDPWRVFPYTKGLVMTSRTEGLPVTVLEAMRARLPVISSAVGGVPDMLDYGACGWLISEGSASGFAVSIRDLLENQASAYAKVERAYCRFQDRYTVRRMVAEYDRIYRTVVSSSRLQNEGRGGAL